MQTERRTPLLVKIADNSYEKELLNQFRHNLKLSDIITPLKELDEVHAGAENEEQTNNISLYGKAMDQIVADFEIKIGNPSISHPGLMQIFQLKRFSSFPTKTLSVSNYYINDVASKNPKILEKLFKQHYYVLRSKNIKFDFLTTKQEFLTLFQQLGYREFLDKGKAGKPFVALILLTEDYAHMEAIHSPLLEIASRYRNSTHSSKWFSQSFQSEQSSSAAPAAPTSKTEQNIKLAMYLHTAFKDQHFIFNHLSVYEIERVLNFATVYRYEPGEHMVKKGDIGNEIFIILIGKAEVQRYSGSETIVLAEFGPGHIFGEIAFLSAVPRTADVVATSPIQAFKLTQIVLKKIMKNMPEIATKILFNLSLVLCERLALNTTKLVIKKTMEPNEEGEKPEGTASDQKIPHQNPQKQTAHS